MRRTEKNAIHYSAYRSRIQLNEALEAARRGEHVGSALLAGAEALRSTASSVPESKAAGQYTNMASIVEILARLLNWRNAIRDAEMDADRYRRSAKFAAKEFKRKLDSQTGVEMFVSASSRVNDISNPDEISALVSTLSCMPLPLPLFDRSGPRTPRRPPAPLEGKTDRIAVAFSSFELDGKPFLDPQRVQSGVIHDLTIKTNLSRWPPAAEKLTFIPLSIEPSESYEFPIFEFERPQTNAPFELTKTARVVVKLRTSVFARPLEFIYGARFLPEKEEFTVSVQGQYRLKVRSDDPARHS